MGYQLRKIYIWPAIKISFFLFAIFGVAIGIGWVTLVSLFTSFLRPFLPEGWELAKISGMSLLAGVFLSTSAYAGLGVVFAVIVCLVYNAVANWTGGFEIDLDKVRSVVSIPDGGEKEKITNA